MRVRTRPSTLLAAMQTPRPFPLEGEERARFMMREET